MAYTVWTFTGGRPWQKLFLQCLDTVDFKWIGLNWIRIRVIVGFWCSSVWSFGSNYRVSCLYSCVLYALAILYWHCVITIDVIPVRISESGEWHSLCHCSSVCHACWSWHISWYRCLYNIRAMLICAVSSLVCHGKIYCFLSSPLQYRYCIPLSKSLNISQPN
jgi:hypothetical protein